MAIFIHDVNEVLPYTAPFILCLVLWKMFVTNRVTPRGDVTVLGLDASTYSPKRQALTLRPKNLVNLVNPVDVDRPFVDRITELTRPG